MNGTVSGQQLRAFIERIERLEEEKRTIADDIKEVKAEAKGCGFDLPTINAILKLRKKDAAERDEEQAMLDLYMSALGMLPLFEESASYSEAKGIDRDARRKQRMSESMDDAKALSAEAAALGLIDPAAHAETVRLTDAIANKYGAGVIDPETGEITDNQESGAVSKSGVTYAVSPASDESEADDVGATASSTNSNSPADILPSEANKAGEAPSSPASPAALSDDEPFEPVAFLRKSVAEYRPFCQRPDACGASGLKHCYTCQRSIDAADAAEHARVAV